MNIELIVISGILVMCVFLPFFLIPLLQSRGNRNLQKKFREETLKNLLNIDVQEKWNQNIVGIDSAQKKLLFVQKLEEEFVTDTADLSRLKSSRLIVTDQEKKINGRKESILKRIELEISFLHLEEKQILCLYDYDLNYNQDLEVKNAEKVNALVQKYIISRPVLQQTA